MQGNRLRQIDDFTESLVNRVESCPETVKVDGVQLTAAVVKLWARLIQRAEVQVAFASGQMLKGHQKERAGS